jgi:hypothetical protein
MGERPSQRALRLEEVLRLRSKYPNRYLCIREFNRVLKNVVNESWMEGPLLANIPQKPQNRAGWEKWKKPSTKSLRYFPGSILRYTRYLIPGAHMEICTLTLLATLFVADENVELVCCDFYRQGIHLITWWNIMPSWPVPVFGLVKEAYLPTVGLPCDNWK